MAIQKQRAHRGLTHACRRNPYIGSDDHNLYALVAHSGQLLWKFPTRAGIRSTPAVSGHSVYVLSLDGNLYSVDAHSGKLQWKFATAGESRNSAQGLYGLSPSLESMPDPWDFFVSSPAVANDTVYFGSGNHHVYAVNAQTGALLWKFATGTDATHFMQGIPGSPAVSDNTVVFGSRDNFIYALDSHTGRQLWREANHNSWVIASPAIQNGTVYITTSDSMLFRALDLKTGASRFDLPYLAYSFSSPALASGHAYFGTFDGRLYDVDLAARRYASQFQVQAARNHPSFFTTDGHLNAAAIYGPILPDGQPNNTLDATIVGIERLLSLGSILSSPVVDQGIVYCASTDGSVYALD